jgi:hypothetical protein
MLVKLNRQTKLVKGLPGQTVEVTDALGCSLQSRGLADIISRGSNTQQKSTMKYDDNARRIIAHKEYGHNGVNHNGPDASETEDCND